MEEVKIFVKKFKIWLGILASIIVVFGVLFYKASIEVISTVKVFKEYVTTQATLHQKTIQLEELSQKERQQDNTRQLKDFFKPIGQAIDTETAIANEFAEILELMKSHAVKIYSIQYAYDPEDDNFVKNLRNRYSVAKLDLQMIANYRQFEELLKDLYRHEHFLDIAVIDVRPYESNKKILIMDLQLKLYAQKN